jgi:hypothetical protein
MPELPLDHRQRHPLAGEFDRMSMPQLMWRKPAPDASCERVAAQLRTRCGGRPGPAASRSVDHAEQRADRQLDPARDPGSEMVVPGPGIESDLATPITLAFPYQDGPASRVEIGLDQRQRFLDS